MDDLDETPLESAPADEARAFICAVLLRLAEGVPAGCGLEDLWKLLIILPAVLQSGNEKRLVQFLIDSTPGLAEEFERWRFN